MNALRLAALAVFCTAAVYCDLRYGKIPNLLNGIAILSGLILACAAGGPNELASAATGALIGFSILIVPFLLHMVGGGDVKFLASAGAIIGWQSVWASFLMGAALGGAIAAALLVVRERSFVRLKQRFVLLRAGVLSVPPDMQRKVDPAYDVKVPYSLPLSLGLLIVCSVRSFA